MMPTSLEPLVIACGGSRQRQGVVEAVAMSAARAIGSQVGSGADPWRVGLVIKWKRTETVTVPYSGTVTVNSASTRRSGSRVARACRNKTTAFGLTRPSELTIPLVSTKIGWFRSTNSWLRSRV